MKGLARRIGGLSAALLLTACVSSPEKVEVSASRLANIDTISIVRVPEPANYAVVNLGHPGMAFGLIGGLVADADENSKEGRLTAAFKENGVAVGNELTNQLVAKLSSAGYRVDVIEGSWTVTDGFQELDYGTIHSDADAVLVVKPTISGFVTTSPIADYEPTFKVLATLMGPDDREEIYKSLQGYGWSTQGSANASASIPTFANVDAIMTDIAGASGALYAAGDVIANNLTAELSK